MKGSLFFQLAKTGMKKNKKIYLPFILTCIGMITMFYIMNSLASTPLLSSMRQGDNLRMVLLLGRWVIGIFSLIFLFYTNSFLIRRRNREFGLYYVLGMDKHGIGKILAFEFLMIAGWSLFSGLFLGIALSKFAELGLLNILHLEVDFVFRISFDAIFLTLIIFIVIFFLLFLNALRQVHQAHPLELLHSANVGEKAPKANWVLALLGAMILGGAYYIAVTIQSPVQALTLFFLAVILVIIATYMLFTAGSVALCKILQKNRKYYYNRKHFFSVAFMSYRMKRNGAGLASICILSTMVLVMLSSTTSLYIGAEDSMSSSYPCDISIKAKAETPQGFCKNNLDVLRAAIGDASIQGGFSIKNLQDYRYATIAGMMVDGKLEADVTAFSDAQLSSVNDIFQIYIVPLEDYNRIVGENRTLSENEVLLSASQTEYHRSTIQIATAKEMNVKDIVPNFVENKMVFSVVAPSLFLVVDDFDHYLEPMQNLLDYNGDKMLGIRWYYGFDVEGDDATQLAAYDAVTHELSDVSFPAEEGILYFFSECLAEQRSDFYTTYGGLFFIGIVLSMVFVFATVLIIYYKQVSEGYEDQSRFEIMQNVGMTAKNIKETINSQVLTIFFAPLILAGMHLSFAFPLVWKILMLFGLNNLPLAIAVHLGAFLLFAFFYAVIYRITAGTYYSIVSDFRKKAARS